MKSSTRVLWVLVALILALGIMVEGITWYFYQVNSHLISLP
jgi:hypothetical protein